jgi:hypothetical protein
MPAALQLHDFGMVKKTVEEHAGVDVVAEHRTEVFDGAVAGDDRGAGFVTAANRLDFLETPTIGFTP